MSLRDLGGKDVIRVEETKELGHTMGSKISTSMSSVNREAEMKASTPTILTIPVPGLKPPRLINTTKIQRVK